ncbi:MAG: histidine kinase [Leadbetterella sp.]|nr:histidine kinase [Leadbetterella sp.]
MQNLFKKHKITLMHLAFWAVYFSFFFYQISFVSGNERPVSESLQEAFLHVLFVVIIVYINYSFLLPRFLKDRNFLKYILSFAFFFCLCVGTYIFIKRMETQGTRIHDMFSSTRFLVHYSLTVLFIVIFISMLRFVEEWFGIEARKQEIENEKLNTELRFLKEQINPHFLFNTLNSLYYLAIIQSARTPEVIEKLSQMMRYMLYDSNRPKVQLPQEIEYMQNFIELEKMRIEKPIPITFEISGDVSSIRIVPLILNTFLENAFKHGLNNHSTNGFIRIMIHADPNLLIFMVENSKPEHPDSKEKSGIGLQNVKRRLELSYPEKHNLEITEDENHYKIILTLDLA